MRHDLPKLPLRPDLPVFGNADEDDAVQELLYDIIQHMDVEVVISLVDVLCQFRATDGQVFEE